MPIELKGLLAGLAAAAIALAAAFGFAALMRSAAPAAVSPAKNADAKTAPSGSSALTQAQITKGHGFYTQSCASCHGAQGQGGIGPNLYNSDLSDAQIVTTIRQGIAGKMPAFGDTYKDADALTIAAYLRTFKK